MPLHRFPIIFWPDAQGFFTAIAIDGSRDDPLAATAPTAKRVRDELKDYLTWLYQKEPWRESLNLVDLELKEFVVPVRAEYQSEGRLFPTNEPFALRVPCLVGRRPNGPYFAVLPMLDFQFYYHDPASLRELVSEYVRQQLKGSTPRDLAAALPPADLSLDEIVVRVKDRPRTAQSIPDFPALSAVAEPLDDRAARRRFARAWLRESEAATLARQLADARANLLLVGPTGVGKTTMLAEAIRQLDHNSKPAADANEGEGEERLRFWLTSAGRLIAGMQYLGQWEARCQQIIEELSGGVLCVENLLELAMAGGEGPGDGIAMFFLPYLERGELRLVGEATAGELTALRRFLPSLVDLFQIVPVAPLDRPRALAVLDRQAAAHRQQSGIVAADGVSGVVYNLFRRFSPYDTFPGQCVGFYGDLLDRTRRAGGRELTIADAVAAFVRRTGLPEPLLRDDLPLGFDDVLAGFRREMVGQDAACQDAARLVIAFKAGLNDPERPLGVLLFSGPTGVGKTQLAKTLCRYLFEHGDERDRLVRLDMSEYAGFDAAERLLGRPNGQPSELVKRVRRQPFVVVLLDEIEKASPEVFDILLGVFDEGRLTDAFGRTTDFRSAVVIITSNLGGEASQPPGFDVSILPNYEGAITAFFRPEFYNRLDAVVRLEPLTPEQVRLIARKELDEVARREGLAKAGIELVATDRLIEHLATVGYDARYGARPLQRVIERQIVTPLARWLIAHRGFSGPMLTLDIDAVGGLVIGD